MKTRTKRWIPHKHVRRHVHNTVLSTTTSSSPSRGKNARLPLPRRDGLTLPSRKTNISLVTHASSNTAFFQDDSSIPVHHLLEGRSQVLHPRSAGYVPTQQSKPTSRSLIRQLRRKGKGKGKGEREASRRIEYAAEFQIDQIVGFDDSHRRSDL
jgi:hypothetical protein